jgi:hypothetical protein
VKKDTLLTEYEAAVRLGCSVQRVRQLRYSGKAPQPVRVPDSAGRPYHVRYKLGDCDKVRLEQLARGGGMQ